MTEPSIDSISVLPSSKLGVAEKACRANIENAKSIEFPRLGGEHPNTKTQRRALGAWNRNLVSRKHQISEEEETPASHSAPTSTPALVTTDVSKQPEVSSSKSTKEAKVNQQEPVSHRRLETEEKKLEVSKPTTKQQEEPSQRPIINASPSLAQVKMGAILKVMLVDSIQLLGNFSYNYCGGLTRMEAGMPHIPHDKEMYSRQLSRWNCILSQPCDP